MNDSRLYHNPRCSKSREALGLLQQREVALQVIDYLETPPSVDDLRALLSMLGLPAHGLLRSGEPEYAELSLGDAGKSDEELIDAMARHPRLIERPILVHDGRAVIGRPPERVLELLD